MSTTSTGPRAAGCAEAYATEAAACEKIGRDPAEITWSVAVTPCCGSHSAEIARRRAAVTAKSGGDPSYIIKNVAAGTPGEVVGRLGAFEEAGANRVYLQLFDLLDLDHLRLVAKRCCRNFTESFRRHDSGTESRSIDLGHRRCPRSLRGHDHYAEKGK
jgi:alkanesulfonate monooxygenase SsuD/methylene tetrahydromethanopterin reductase-like flavin-dependent oxidoreductase (luciferase family)